MQLGGGQLHSKKFLSILGFCKVHVEKLLVYLYVYNTFGVMLLYDVVFVSCQLLSGTMTHPNRGALATKSKFQILQNPVLIKV